MVLQDKLTSPFVIDGKQFPNVVIVSIKRNFSVLDGSNAGRTASGGMIRDVIGTYYNYTVEFRSKESHEDEYEQLFELLSTPTDYHTLELPFGDKTIKQKMYCTSGGDTLKRFSLARTNRFQTLSINFVAMTAYVFAGG